MRRLVAWILIPLSLLGLSACNSTDVTNDAVHSVVKLERKAPGHATAFHIGNGVYVTASHATTNDQPVKLTPYSGNSFKAKFVKRYSPLDLVVYKSTSGGKPHPKLTLDCRSPKRGEHISIIGFPAFYEYISGYGQVASDLMDIDIGNSIFTMDLTVVHGQSGGPVLSSDGDVIGVTSAVIGAPPKGSITGYSLATSITSICNELKNLTRAAL